MGFNEEYLKLRKLRLKDEENGKAREIITPYRRPLASDVPTSTVTRDDDIAPVFTTNPLDLTNDVIRSRLEASANNTKNTEEETGLPLSASSLKVKFMFSMVMEPTGISGRP